MRLGSASSESGSEDDSIIRLVCLRVLVVPLVARAVRDGAEATWRTTLLRLDPSFVNGAWGWRHRPVIAVPVVPMVSVVLVPVVSVVCGRFTFVHVVLFT